MRETYDVHLGVRGGPREGGQPRRMSDERRKLDVESRMEGTRTSSSSLLPPSQVAHFDSARTIT